jgi:YidC/Oxa1 family membrane protein insertase
LNKYTSVLANNQIAKNEKQKKFPPQQAPQQNAVVTDAYLQRQLLEKHKQEMLAKVYQEAGYNPMSGCLPMIVQFFVLFAMYNLFNNYFEFRGASFIPHWINDLSVGDSVYTLKVNIPFIGNHIRILPLIYLASQLFYGKITNNGGAAPSSTKMQMNLMMYGMPILFFFIFYNAPSGLLLYWTVSNIIQMVQQIVINNLMKKKKAELAKK